MAYFNSVLAAAMFVTSSKPVNSIDSGGEVEEKIVMQQQPYPWLPNSRRNLPSAAVLKFQALILHLAAVTSFWLHQLLVYQTAISPYRVRWLADIFTIFNIV